MIFKGVKWPRSAIFCSSYDLLFFSDLQQNSSLNYFVCSSHVIIHIQVIVLVSEDFRRV